MTTLILPQAKAAPLEAAAFTETEAAAFCKLSGKTLTRAALAGEPVGRVKYNRRVVYLKAALEAWLASKVQTVAISNTH